MATHDTDNDRDKPDVAGARENLERIRGQREAVEELVTALVLDRHLNNFTANIIASFRGGRA